MEVWHDGIASFGLASCQRYLSYLSRNGEDVSMTSFTCTECAKREESYIYSETDLAIELHKFNHLFQKLLKIMDKAGILEV